ncbi:NAD(P)/FAD-dependent oxidoreductase [Haloarchaeobius sp. HME9146]|uniref:dihydrolipoyl dehydrogenase family protein n=1 Tax=Haloarchaeobius sp. HME9146 TaxID=2978732 RepID=UPI0021C00CD2|nr:NAD(P)/FAD-dependent oxidoreductase [Haloarchaeobius sp. HME9146]MCT9095535.1 NAD(P)/FAD-dependent oxidoreductase [Haloarchaeobius sp. HME9146]
MTHVAIIGAYGSAGAAVAGELADEPGIELTLIDDGEPGGGLCILRGCMPSKEVLSAGAHRFQARHDHRLAGDLPEIDLEAVVEQKNEHTLSWAGHRRDSIHDLAERENVEFVHDTAQFVDDRVLAVGGETIEPDYVVVATGSVMNVPELPGMESVDFMTSSEILDATEFPDSGIVMGFGYIGMELVPYIAEAGGTSLTVVEHDARPIDEADAPFGDAALDIYEEHWDIDVRRHAYEKRIEQTDDGGVRLYLEEDGEETVVEADELFLFTGRRPNLDRLGLDATSLDPEAGWVRDTMQAREDDHVFVVGDVNGKEPILHVAKEQGFTAADNILAHARGDDLTEYENVHHHVIFSGLGVYPFARVGHSKFSAEEAGLDYIHVSREASDDGVFKTKDVPEGLASLVVDANDGTVLGYQGLHYHADVMAKTLQLAVEMELDVRELPDRAYHPTTPEILDGLFRDATNKL